MPRKHNGHDRDDTPAEFGVPKWMQLMRQAACAEIRGDDIRAIVRNQIELAKQGDSKAMKFVFEQVLGGAAMQGATFIQHNYGGGGSGVEPGPTRALPGDEDKLDAFAARAARGEPLHDPRDARRDLS